VLKGWTDRALVTITMMAAVMTTRGSWPRRWGKWRGVQRWGRVLHACEGSGREEGWLWWGEVDNFAVCFLLMLIALEVHLFVHVLEDSLAHINSLYCCTLSVIQFYEVN